LDAAHEARTTSGRQAAAAEQARDRVLRAKADIRALCGPATDILIGSIAVGHDTGYSFVSSHRVHVINRIWALPKNTSSARADSFAEYPQRRQGAEDVLFAATRDERMIRCRVGDPSLNDGRAHPDTSSLLIMFLRRGPFVRAGGAGYRVYWPADSANAFLPADPPTVRLVRRELERRSSENTSATRCSECEGSFEAVTSLQSAEASRVSLKITRLVGHGQSFLFGVGIGDRSIVDFSPCALPGELYLNDYVTSPYPIQLTQQRLRDVLGAVERVLSNREEPQKGTPFCVLSVRGLIAGRGREFEAILTAEDLKRLSDAIGGVVRDDRTTAWYVNYWRYSTGSPLTPDTGFQLGGPR